MRMKHWAYMGLVLLVGQESLMGGVVAGQFLYSQPTYNSPMLRAFRGRLESVLPKPAVPMVSPVLIRLFDDSRMQALWLKSSSSFYLSGRKTSGPIYVAMRANKLHVYKGKRRIIVTDFLKVQTMGGQPFQAQNASGSRKWLTGELRVSIVNGRLKIINKTELEEYVAGILEGELGSVKLPREVLKAQMVVARSYTLSMRKGRHSGQGYEFCDQPHCQVYRGVIRKEVHPTLGDTLMPARGQFISYKKRPIPAFYHHNCGGVTSNIEEVWPSPARPYLKAVSEDARGVCRVSASSTWKVVMTKRRLTECFKQAGILGPKDSIKSILVVQKDNSGRVQRLSILAKKPINLTVGKFRNTINQYYKTEVLKSALFTLHIEQGDNFVAYGRGWGHGIGFCQEGALWMARHGYTYDKILKHYFPNTEIRSL
jgi:stage II sporulation protein D